MFSTTLRIPDDLAAYLQEEAKAESLSVNALLSRLIQEHREGARRRRLAAEWAAYAADDQAQDVAFALDAQADLAAEPEAPFGGEAPKPRRRKG